MAEIVFDAEKVAHNFYCHAPHPDYTESVVMNTYGPPVQVSYVHCGRQPGHDGEHSAFAFKISVPVTWST